MKLKYCLIAFFIIACFWMSLFNLYKSEIKTELLTYKGNQAFYDDDFGVAEIYYRKGLSILPKSTIIRYNLGNALSRQGRYIEAIEHYKLSIKYDKNNIKADSWNNLGKAYFLAKRLNESANSFKVAVLTQPTDTKIRSNFLFVMRKLNEKHSRTKLEESKNSQETGQSNKDEKGDGSPPQSDNTTAKDSESLLDMVSQNEERSKAKISRAKRKATKLKPNEMNY